MQFGVEQDAWEFLEKLLHALAQDAKDSEPKLGEAAAKFIDVQFRAQICRQVKLKTSWQISRATPLGSRAACKHLIDHSLVCCLHKAEGNKAKSHAKLDFPLILGASPVCVHAFAAIIFHFGRSTNTGVYKLASLHQGVIS